jgi:hypothetical protein
VPPPSEPPGRPWWLVPLLVVLAFFGAVFLVRAVIGFLAGLLTLAVAVAVVGFGVYWFMKKD